MNEDCIVHEVLYPYPIWTVWQALTSSEALAQWLMPNDFVPQVGHRFTFRTEPQHGWNGHVECQVKDLIAPHRLAFTWRGGNHLPTTLVTFTLEAIEQQTLLRLEHSGFASGGAQAITIRNLLDSGWGSKVLHKNLPTVLAQLAARS